MTRRGFPTVATVTMVLFIVSVVTMSTTAAVELECSDGLCRLSITDFAAVTNKAGYGNPEYWYIRFREPSLSSSSSSPPLDVFAETAKALSSTCRNGTTTATDETLGCFVHFGEVVMDTAAAWTLADGLGMSQFPTIMMYGAKTTRAIGPKGALQYGRALFLPQVVSTKSMTTVKDFRTFVLAHVPTRYIDGVTSFSVDTPTFVFSRKDVYTASAQWRRQYAAGVVSVLPSYAVVVRLRLTSKGDEEYLAALSAASVSVGLNGVVFVTEDPDVASRFHISEERSGTIFEFPFPDDVSVPIVPLRTTTTPFESLESITQFVRQVVTIDPTKKKSAEEQIRAINRQWSQDVAHVMHTEPLRRINDQDQFLSDIEEAKMTIVVLYLFRESDDVFMRDYNSAVEVAKAVQNSYASSSPLAATRDRVRFEVFWLDAEVHKGVAQTLKPQAVPSVAVLYGLQDGKRGVRYLKGGKKGDAFPSASEVISFLTGPKLMDTTGRDLFPVDLTHAVFTSPEDTLKFYRQHRLKMKITTTDTIVKTKYVVDRKVYPTEATPENPFVSQMIEGKVKLDEGSNNRDTEKGRDDKKNPNGKNKKKSSKKLAREEAEKKKLEEELLRKKQDKEARIQKKAEESQKAREEAVKAAQRALREQSKRGGVHKDQDFKNGDEETAHDGEEEERNEGKKRGGGGRRRSTAAVIVDRPRFSPVKGPKNRFAQRKAWEQDRKEMIAARVESASGSKKKKKSSSSAIEGEDSSSSGSSDAGAATVVFHRQFEL